MKIVRFFAVFPKRMLLGVILFLFALNGSANAEWRIEVLLGKLSEVKQASLDFVEQKQSIFVSGELEATGTIVYEAPDYMKKTITNPFFESILIDGDNIVIEKTKLGGKKDESVVSQSYSIGTDELLSSAVGGILAILAGKIDVLNRDYEAVLTGEEESWNLLLEPKTDVIKEKIESISLSGAGIEIKLIETTHPDGDQSRLSLTYIEIQ